jgi:hypothetical protein
MMTERLVECVTQFPSRIEFIKEKKSNESKFIAFLLLLAHFAHENYNGTKLDESAYSKKRV